jgi:PIN domain nuclease of toxin-antitoxin system
VKLLLDTHAFLWFLAGDPRLRAAPRRRIEAKTNEKYLSIASVWEMAIKVSLGKLHLADPLADLVERGAGENGIALVGISKQHALGVAALPWHHRDPFDRLLVAQAMHEDMALLTADPAFAAYGVRCVW